MSKTTSPRQRSRRSDRDALGSRAALTLCRANRIVLRTEGVRSSGPLLLGQPRDIPSASSPTTLPMPPGACFGPASGKRTCRPHRADARQGLLKLSRLLRAQLARSPDKERSEPNRETWGEAAAERGSGLPPARSSFRARNRRAAEGHPQHIAQEADPAWLRSRSSQVCPAAIAARSGQQYAPAPDVGAHESRRCRRFGPRRRLDLRRSPLPPHRGGLGVRPGPAHDNPEASPPPARDS